MLYDIVQNLELIDKGSVHVDWLLISDQNIKMLCESHRDKLWRLQIDIMNLTVIGDKISIETVEVLNEIKLNTVSIEVLDNSFENFKMCLNLNSINAEVCF